MPRFFSQRFANSIGSLPYPQYAPKYRPLRWAVDREGIHYPAKLLISRANIWTNGAPWPSRLFSGGRDCHKFRKIQSSPLSRPDHCPNRPGRNRCCPGYRSPGSHSVAPPRQPAYHPHHPAYTASHFSDREVTTRNRNVIEPGQDV
jgi:hypothetical protein